LQTSRQKGYLEEKGTWLRNTEASAERGGSCREVLTLVANMPGGRINKKKRGVEKNCGWVMAGERDITNDI